MIQFTRIQLENGLNLRPYELGTVGDDQNTIIHHKDQNTLLAYAELFGSVKGFNPSKIFEIGIKQGGSLVVWDIMFKNCKIAAIDIDLLQIQKSAMSYIVSKNITIKQICAPSPEILKFVNDTLGICDLIIDDGAHTIDAIPVSLRQLWPLLRSGGLYVIEDWAALHQIHRMVLLDEIVNKLIGDPNNKSTAPGNPYCLYIFRNLIAIRKN